MAYVQESSPFKKLKKTTKGKGRHFLSAKEGAGMTAAGRKAYNRETGGNLKALNLEAVSVVHHIARAQKGKCKCTTLTVRKHRTNASAQHAVDGTANKK